jgi:hypothetical protein
MLETAVPIIHFEIKKFHSVKNHTCTKDISINNNNSKMETLDELNTKLTERLHDFGLECYPFKV